MALRLPPANRVDAPIIYVSPKDGAWDRSRIQREKDAALLLGEDPSGHPYERYIRGDTRYDLDAPCLFGGETHRASEYLDGSEWRYKLRRLGPKECYEIDSMFASGDRLGAGMSGCEKAWVGLDGRGAPKLRFGISGPSDEAMDAAYHAQEDGMLPAMLGFAAYNASQPLKDSEGKQ